MYKAVFRVAVKVSLFCLIFNVHFVLRVLFVMYNAIYGAYAITCVSTLPKDSNMVDRYSENRRASNYKPTLKERKKTEQDKGDFSLLLTNKSSTPIARNQQLNTSPIMQPSFHLGKNPSGNDSLFQESSESVFCTPNKVKHCLSFLNKEFAGMGLPPIARSRSESGDVVCLVNNTYQLVQRQHQTYRMKEEQEIRQIQTDGEVNRLYQVRTKMLTQLEEKERKLTQFQLLVSQLEMKNKQLSNALKAEKEEVQRLQSVMQQRLVQYKHESKKKELECNRLKDRLHQVLVERTEKPGLVISAVLPSNPKFRNDESVFRAVSANYEETQRKLLLENSDFRCTLCSFQNELMELVQMADPNLSLASAMTAPEDGLDSTQVLELSSTSSSTLTQESSQKLPKALFEMPFELVESDILKSFRLRLSSLKNVIEQLKAQASVQNIQQNEDRVKLEDVNRKQDDEIKRLQESVEHLRSIVNQQQAFIMSQFEQGTAEVSFLRDTEHLEEERWSQAEQFVAEARQRLNDVTAKIIEEMAEEHSKNCRTMQSQFMTPLRPDLLGQKSTASNRTISGIQTPSCAQMGKSLQLPGTAELYKKLGLSAFVFQSSPFVAKSPVVQTRFDETKENVDPHDLNDDSPLTSAVMEGTNDLGSRVKVQLFSQKQPTATGNANHGNAFQQELTPEDNLCGVRLQADEDKIGNDFIPSAFIDQDQTIGDDLDQNVSLTRYLDKNNSIRFDED